MKKLIEKIEEYKATPVQGSMYKTSDLLLEEISSKLNEIIDRVNEISNAH